jgi:hypothetical protein
LHEETREEKGVLRASRRVCDNQSGSTYLVPQAQGQGARRREQSNESGRKRERERGASYDTIGAMMTILFSTIQGGRVSKELITVKYL